MKTNLNVDMQALREKILDLAMRGKLVEQDVGDEPSKDLDGAINIEGSHQIPSNWRWVTLGKIVKLYNGRAYKKDELLDDDSLTPVLRVGNLFTNSSWYYSDLKLEENKYIDTGDLIYAWSASFGPKIWLGPKVIYHYHIWKIELSEYVDKKFLYYFLLDDRNIVGEADIHGSTMKHLTKKNMETLKIPLPPLAEQKRIADKVSELFKQVDVIEKNVAEYQDLEQAMRSKLLDLAMRGKLVEQDPSDEPASELLNQIQVEKAKLVKEGKIKKSKKLPGITDDEKPFDIPDSWEWVRLGNITIITSGGTPSKSKKEYWESGDIPWITPALMGKAKHKTYKGETGYINKIGLSNSSAKLIPKNSIVYSSRAPIGHINVVSFDYTTNQGCKSVTPINENIDFLYYTLMQQTPNIISRASGTTFKEISGSKFAETPIPLPPLAEQKRIADKLTRLFENLDTIKQNLATVS